MGLVSLIDNDSLTIMTPVNNFTSPDSPPQLGIVSKEGTEFTLLVI